VTVLEQLPQGARVLIIRLRSLGDCVLTTPALRILKTARPDLAVGLVVERRFREIFEGNPDIDAILDPSAATVLRWRSRLAINFHGGTRSVILTAASLARFRVGFGHYRHQWAYNVRLPRAQEVLGVVRKVHTAEHLASAMFFLGVPPGEIPRARLFTQLPEPAAPYAVIHPLASSPEKTWPALHFVEMGCQLMQSGLEPVFIGAAGDDLTAFSSFRCLQGASLREVKNLLAGAALFVGNDSGPAHMAAALGIPLVVLFGNSDPVVWAPWRARAEVIAAGEGLSKVPLAAVLEAVQKLRTVPVKT
jgi:ADP-heptose:LPS heptosyltransferase